MRREKDKYSDGQVSYHFRLFVAGDEPNSRKAKETIQRFCESRLKGRYRLDVVDVLEDYRSALENNILLAPTLVILAPPPEVKIIGSLNDGRRISEALGLPDTEEDV
ncbi:MAG: circadian clock KaiB family protein [Thermodesulfobacteriota bacterium]